MYSERFRLAELQSVQARLGKPDPEMTIYIEGRQNRIKAVVPVRWKSACANMGHLALVPNVYINVVELSASLYRCMPGPIHWTNLFGCS